jgi:hypothetical protein
MKPTLRLLVAGLVALAPVAAGAQQQEEQQKEAPIPDPNIPDNPVPRPRTEVQSKPAPRYGKEDYPIEIIKRPLTLAASQAEVSLDVPFVSGDATPLLTQVLRGAYGVTRDVQLGLTYSFGLERLNAPPGTDGYEAGKAVSIDAAYTILPGYLAASLKVPVYLSGDNFGLGLILGAPFRVELFDRFAVFGGTDLVHIKITGMAVDAADPAFIAGELALKARGAVTSAGSVNATVGALYQVRPQAALFASFGIAWLDFSANDQPVSLFAGGTYSPQRTIDIGGRVGFASLAHAGQSFTLAVTVALRL